jgi:hypothetical protein
LSTQKYASACPGDDRAVRVWLCTVEVSKVDVASISVRVAVVAGERHISLGTGKLFLHLALRG